MTSSRWPRVFQSRTFLAPLTILILCLTSGATRTRTAQPDSDKSKASTVNCSAGQSINHALSHSKPGETILIQGTCHERVVLTQAVTLDGAGSGVIDGSGVALGQSVDAEFDGLVMIDGVTNVKLVGLTIQNATANAIFAAHGAAVVLRHVTTQNNAKTGIVVIDNSTAEAIDSVTTSNLLGFDVVTSSSLVLKGTFASTGNGTNGGDINGQSIVELRGAQVTVSDNQQFGIIAGSRSHVAVFGWEAATGSTLTASGNGVAGLGFADSTLSTFSNSVITASNNGVGLLIAPGGEVDSPPFAGATFVMHDNGVGMNMRPGSSVFMIGGLNVHDNGIGVSVDEASLYVESGQGLSASVAGNSTNVQLTFGSRSTIENVTIGTPLVCDSTVLSRGTTTCP